MRQKIEEIRQLEIADIRHRITTLEKELYNLRYQVQTSRVEKPHRFKELRKDIARCETIIREKELRDAGKQQK
jgi:large subunit ribosomal protein L29